MEVGKQKCLNSTWRNKKNPQMSDSSKK